MPDERGEKTLQLMRRTQRPRQRGFYIPWISNCLALTDKGNVRCCTSGKAIRGSIVNNYHHLHHASNIYSRNLYFNLDDMVLFETSSSKSVSPLFKHRFKIYILRRCLLIRYITRKVLILGYGATVGLCCTKCWNLLELLQLVVLQRIIWRFVPGPCFNNVEHNLEGNITC